MALQSHHLEAFIVIAKTRNFSKAAQQLHVTQSALSHRISALEEEIGAPLFIRERFGVSLTELGSELLQYVRTKDALESEFLVKVRSSPGQQLCGVLRIGCYASIGRSIVLKALLPFLVQSPKVQLFFMIRETRDLPEMLKSGEADLIFLDSDQGRGKIKSEVLGEEEYVLVESSQGCVYPEIYLNHDEDDLMTYRFYEKQGEKNRVFQRTYLDEIYSCVDGVAEGLGRSVLPLHLVKSNPKIKIHTGFKNLKMPVILHYYQPTVMPQLLKKVLETLRKQVPILLKGAT